MENINKRKQKRIKNLSKIIILIIIILLIFLLVAKFIKKPFKSSKIGNNSSSQEIEDFILNISSYEAVIDMDVYSNKNSCKYKIKQVYKNENDNYQEVLEPSNIAGIKIKQERDKLIMENSKLNLSKIMEEYKYVTDNCIDLMSFINEYKKDEDRKVKEEGNVLSLETTSGSPNKYLKYKTLKIDRKTGKPISMEIKSASKKTVIYIIYNEVEINN